MPSAPGREVVPHATSQEDAAAHDRRRERRLDVATQRSTPAVSAARAMPTAIPAV
jgi:hypothetical protein